MSAVESAPQAEASELGPSPKLVERLVEQAIEKCRTLENGLVVERRGLRRQLFALAGVAAAATLIIALGPAFLRHGMSALLIVYRSAEAASPYKIEVTPGNTKIPRGADQNVKAKLLGFTAKEAVLMFRLGAEGRFERMPLVASAADASSFEGILFHVEKTAEYYVESNGVRSPSFKVDVQDLPTVDRLVVEYHFPQYTGLQPRTVDPGGDVAALADVEVVGGQPLGAVGHREEGDLPQAFQGAAEHGAVGVDGEGVFLGGLGDELAELFLLSEVVGRSSTKSPESTRSRTAFIHASNVGHATRGAVDGFLRCLERTVRRRLRERCREILVRQAVFFRVGGRQPER